MAADRTRRERFADHVARYMNENRFDGVDLDWGGLFLFDCGLDDGSC